VAACVRFIRESFGALQQMVSAVPEREHEATWKEIEQELRAFEATVVSRSEPS